MVACRRRAADAGRPRGGRAQRLLARLAGKRLPRCPARRATWLHARSGELPLATLEHPPPRPGDGQAGRREVGLAWQVPGGLPRGMVRARGHGAAGVGARRSRVARLRPLQRRHGPRLVEWRANHVIPAELQVVHHGAAPPSHRRDGPTRREWAQRAPPLRGPPLCRTLERQAGHRRPRRNLPG